MKTVKKLLPQAARNSYASSKAERKDGPIVVDIIGP